MLWWSQLAHWRGSCTLWLQQAGAAASHGLHVAYEDCVGSAAGAMLAVLCSPSNARPNYAFSQSCQLKDHVHPETQCNLVYETLSHSTF